MINPPSIPPWTESHPARAPPARTWGGHAAPNWLRPRPPCRHLRRKGLPGRQPDMEVSCVYVGQHLGGDSLLFLEGAVVLGELSAARLVMDAAYIAVLVTLPSRLWFPEVFLIPLATGRARQCARSCYILCPPWQGSPNSRGLSRTLGSLPRNHAFKLR
ncbi:hypothetical protein VUR80DRAFT_1788 [Thermomyces stellatus]